mgnify:CR=1 FL=1
MFVIVRNGKTTVLTGWRAWLAGAAVLIAAWFALAFVAFVMVGVAVTAGAALIILVPALIVVSIMGSIFRR